MKGNRGKSKGFTLIELIVVLVILGILAAMLVPALTRYIRKAHEEEAILECKLAVEASQTLASEGYEAKDYSYLVSPYTEVVSLSEVPGKIRDIQYVSDTGIITELKYRSRKGIVVLYKNGKYSIIEDDIDDSDSTTAGATTTTESNVDTEAPDGGTTESGVTVKDSKDKEYNISISGDWNQIKKEIAEVGANLDNGLVYQDSSGVFVSINNPWIGKDKNGLTLAQIVEAQKQVNSTWLLEINENSRVFTIDDTTSTWGNMHWKEDDLPKTGDLCYWQGNMYIASGDINAYTFPPSGWILIK